MAETRQRYAALICAALVMAGCGTGRLAPAPQGTGLSSDPSLSAAGPAGVGASGNLTAVLAGRSRSAAGPVGAQFAPYYRPTGAATVRAGVALPMTVNDFSFQPNTLTVRMGTVVRLRLHNASTEAHDLSFPAFGIDVPLPAGKTTAITFTAKTAGTYWFWCDLPGHAEAGMVGRLTVSA